MTMMIKTLNKLFD